MSRLVIHGDSNTAEIYSLGAANWTRQVTSSLGFTELVNFAVSGRQAYQVLADVPNIINQHPALCLIMIGTNDMAHGVDDGIDHQAKMVEYLQLMTSIIDQLKAAGVPLAIMSPIFSQRAREAVRFPDWIACLQTTCMIRNIPFIDVWSHMVALSAVQPDTQFQSYFRAPSLDPWHLSDAGHAMIAQLVLARIQSNNEQSARIRYQGAAQSSENLDTYTFPAQSIGAATEDRSVVIAVASRANASRALVGVTIGGITAAPIATRTADVTDMVALYRAAVPAGSSADVVVSFNGQMLRCSIATFSVYGGNMAHVNSAAAGAGASTVSLTLDVFGGAIVAGWFNSTGGAGSLSGVAQDTAQNPETPSNTFLAGHSWSGAMTAGQPIGMTSSVPFNAAAVLVAASWD